MKSDIKILFFSNVSVDLNDFDIRGTGNWISSLVKALLTFSTGYELFVAFHDSKTANLEFSKNINNITLIKIPTNLKSSRFKKVVSNWLNKDIYSNSLNDYLLIIEKSDPDIILIFGLESPFIKLIGKTKIPTVIHIQGLLAPYLYKYYPRFTKSEILIGTGIINLIKGSLPTFVKKSFQKKLEIERSIYKDINYVMGRSDWDYLVIRVLAPNAKYFYCQEVMRQIFYTTEWQKTERNIFHLFTTTSESFYKNIDIIYETIEILECYCPTFDFKWRVAGIDKDDLSVRIMNKRGYNSHKLELLGRLDSNSIVNEMLNSNLFVFPSAIENSPNALQEALLIGMPVVSSYAGGVASLIQNKVNGYLVPEGEPYSLAGQILEINNTYDNAVEVGKRARKKALEANDPEKIIKSLLLVFKEILSN